MDGRRRPRYAGRMHRPGTLAPPARSAAASPTQVHTSQGWFSHREMTRPERQRLLAVLRAGVAVGPLLIGSPDASLAQSPVGHYRTSPLPRMHVITRGAMHVRAVTTRGEVNCVLTPGMGAYWPAGASSVEFWDRSFEAVGVTVQPDSLRLIRLRIPRVGEEAGRTVAAWHAPTRGSAALHALYALLAGIGRSGTDVQAALPIYNAVLALIATEAAATGEATIEAKRSLTWERTLAYIEDHLGEPINCKTVAHALDLHPNYLSRLAPQHAGMAFKEVLRRARLSRAMELLTRTPWPIGRIAEACGYSSAGYFIKVFAAEHGQTPLHFRRASRTADDPAPA